MCAPLISSKDPTACCVAFSVYKRSPCADFSPFVFFISGVSSSTASSLRSGFRSFASPLVFVNRLLPPVSPSCFLMASSSSPWFESISSSFSKRDRKLLRKSFSIPRAENVISVPYSEVRPHLPPPEGFATFFVEQVLNGLRFLLPSFFSEVSQYFQIPLSQLTPNSFRVLCGVSIVFNFYHIPLTPENFHFFFISKTKEVGVFYFAARPFTKFLSNFPTSHKY